MDSLVFIGQNKFFARARVHAFESVKKLLLFSTILTLASLAAYSDANSLQTKIDVNAALIRQKGCAAKDQILQQLAQESEPQVRVNFLGILASCHQQVDPASIEPSLNDADPFVRSQAVVTLGAIGGKTVISDLENVLTGDPNIGVRGIAASWLGSLKDPAAISTLGQALKNEADPNIRIEIIQALKSIGTSAAKAQIKNGKNDPDERVRKMANE